MIIGPINGGLNVGCWLEFFENVRCQLGNKNVSVGLKWSVECRADNSECQCQPPLILGWMSVSDWKNGPVSDWKKCASVRFRKYPLYRALLMLNPIEKRSRGKFCTWIDLSITELYWYMDTLYWLCNYKFTPFARQAVSWLKFHIWWCAAAPCIIQCLPAVYRVCLLSWENSAFPSTAYFSTQTLDVPA